MYMTHFALTYTPLVVVVPFFLQLFFDDLPLMTISNSFLQGHPPVPDNPPVAVFFFVTNLQVDLRAP